MTLVSVFVDDRKLARTFIYFENQKYDYSIPQGTNFKISHLPEKLEVKIRAAGMEEQDLQELFTK